MNHAQALLRTASAASRLGLAVACLIAFSAPRLAVAAGDQSKVAADAKSAAAVVNLNSADSTELQTLPRVGPALAARILEYRKTVGSFKSVDELRNVKGIGDKTLEILRPLVTVSPTGSKGAGGGSHS